MIFIRVGKLYKSRAGAEVKKHTKCNKKFQKIGKIVFVGTYDRTSVIVKKYVPTRHHSVIAHVRCVSVTGV